MGRGSLAENVDGVAAPDAPAARPRRRLVDRPVDDAARRRGGVPRARSRPMAAHGIAAPGRRGRHRPGPRPRPGIPFTLSTVSSRSIEEVAAAAPDGSAGSSSTTRPIRGLTPILRRASGGGRLRGDRPDRRPAGPRLPRARSPQRLQARTCRSATSRTASIGPTHGNRRRLRDRLRRDRWSHSKSLDLGRTWRRSAAGRPCRSSSRGS